MRRKRLLALALSVAMVFSLVTNAAASSIQGLAAAVAEGGSVTITEDFENASTDWGMKASASGVVSVVSDSTGDHGKYLQFNVGNGTSTQAVRNATKALKEMLGDREDLPAAMSTAAVSFDWYIGVQTTENRNGFSVLHFMDGDKVILSLYLDERRGSSDSSGDDSPLYYSTGQEYDTSKHTDEKVQNGNWYTVTVTADFSTHTVDVTVVGGATNIEIKGLEFSGALTRLDTFKIETYHPDGQKAATLLGFDNFSFVYTSSSGGAMVLYVKEVGELPSRIATLEDYKEDFQNVHPAEVEVTLSDGTTATAKIDAGSWKSDKTVVRDDWGDYVWTADLEESDEFTNEFDLQATYTMKYMSDFLETDIDSLNTPETVYVTREQWDAGYSHPASIGAILVNGKAISVDIDQNSWKSVPAFDKNTLGSYVWTANIIAPADNRNHRNLTVSYTMNYAADHKSTHDYENDFTLGIIDWVEWGKTVDKDSGTGNYKVFEIKKDGDNSYLYAESEKNDNPRGTRLNLPGGIVKGAVMEFDWMPVIVANNPADFLFMSPAAYQSYFTLRVDTEGKISYYTVDVSNNDTAIDNTFQGNIVVGNAVSTGLGALNQWVTVRVEFDYIAHTAALTVTPKNGGEPFTAENIFISPDANGLSLVVMRKTRNCNQSANALDNIWVDYTKFGDKDIVDVVNPSDVNVTKDQYSAYKHPAKVTVVLGNGSTMEVPVKEWTADPAFDENKAGDYTWTAELDAPSGYTVHFDLKATYKMTYTEKPYVTGVNNPSTLELEYGTSWDATKLPESVTVILSNGKVVTDAKVSGWTAVRAFNSSKEGIYIYGAKLVNDETRDFSVLAEKFHANEYHAAGDAELEVNGQDELAAQFTYDVYYRISYYKSNNNYNGYERSMEVLDRGVTAVPSGSGILVSWRLLVDEYQYIQEKGKGSIQFNVLRNGVKVATLTDRTNYLDAGGKAGDLYAIEVVKGGEKTVSGYVEALSQAYLSIPVQNPGTQLDKDGNQVTYTLNDAGVADVDGDGQYEIIVKWYPSDAFDSGVATGPSGPTIFDIYKMDGTALWRLNLGLEMPSGAHFNQFMLYDLDEDGKAELFIKTSDGTTSYKPNANGKFDMKDTSTIVSYIGDTSVIPGTNVNSNGHMSNKTNEYVTVFNGLTGEEIHTIEYVNKTGEYTNWGTTGSGGNDGGNRSARYNIAIAYLPKAEGSTETIPAVLLNRGYYDKTTVVAYTLRNGKITMEWNFVALNGEDAAGRGNHNVATGDMDNDGFDEIVIGALAIDHDGKVLWVKDGQNGQDLQGHSDTIHLSAMNPEKPTQLYVFTPSEDKGSTLNGTLSNAANGSRINGIWTRDADVGRGVAANITSSPGFEYWVGNPYDPNAPTGYIFNFFGGVTAVARPSGSMTTNWTVYWDGDLLSELGDGYDTGAGGTAATIYKYNAEANAMEVQKVLTGTHTNNSTKNNPSLTADLFGDWREEIMVPSEDNTELRIYMTTYTTEYMIYSLMQDPVYRNAVANQNTAYNQPAHLGFYLGEDNKDEVLAMELPTPTIRYTTPAKPDTTALEAAIEKAEALKSSDYTASSWASLQAALAAGQDVLEDAGATQEQINAAVMAIENAIKALKTSTGGTTNPGGGTSGGGTTTNPGGTSGGGTTTNPGGTTTPNASGVTTDSTTEGSETTTETTAKPSASTSEDGVSASSSVSESMGAEIVKQADANESDSVVIEPEMPDGVTSAKVTIPGSTLTELGEKTDADVTVRTPAGSVTIPNKALEELGSEGGSVTVSVTTEDKTAKVDILVDGTSVDKVSGGIKAALPIGDGQVAVLVDADGNETVIQKSMVEDGTAYVLLDGAATVKIVDNKQSFADVDDSKWYSDAVDFVSSHELFQGTGDDTFAPEAEMTRAMLATVLWRLESEARAGAGAVNFNDSVNGAWYADAVAWASAAGIVEGTGGNNFSPDKSITREQLATMLYRYAGNVGLDTSKRAALSAYTDGAEVSDWARDAMEWAVAVGLIEGKGNDILDATGFASRGQVATIFQRLVRLLVK